MLTLDNLSDDDRLIANPKGKGAGLTLTFDTAKSYEALKGSTVALDLSATPGTFFRSLIDKLNEGKAESKQLWFKDLTDTYPSGIAASADYQVVVSNTTNANITAAMSGDNAPDFCVAFAPISTTLVTDGFVEVAKTSTHMTDRLTPSTWAVSTSFYNDHKDALQAFTNGLVKSFDFRHNNVNGAAADTANQLKQDISAIVTGVAYWPSAKDLQGWFESTSGQGYTYINQIRNSQLKGANLAGVANPKTAEEVIDTSFLLNACKAYLG